MSKTHNVADVVAQFTYMRAEKGFLVKTPGLKANGEGGDKRVTRDSLNNMPFAPFKHLWNVNSTVILVRHDQNSNFRHNRLADSSDFV